MPFSLQSYDRHSIRLQDYDYSQPGGYFVTVTTYQKALRLGSVEGSNFHFSQEGLIANGEWLNLEKHFPQVKMDAFIIMPNHLHGILFIKDDPVRARREGVIYTDVEIVASPIEPAENVTNPRYSRRANAIAENKLRTGSLGAIVGAFKSNATRLVNSLNHTVGKPLWMRNYYEHIIHDQEDLERIRTYIGNNLIRWIESRRKE